MTENNTVMIDFGDSEGYTPYDGGGPKARLPFEGPARVKLQAFEIGRSESSGNDTLTLTLSVAEEGLGGTLYATLPITGTRKDGVPNAHKFFDILTSCGWSMAQIAELRAGKVKKPVNEIMQQLQRESPTCYVEVVDDEYKGKVSSKVQNFITADQYKKRLPARTSVTAAPAKGSGSTTTNGQSKGPTKDPLADVLS